MVMLMWAGVRLPGGQDLHGCEKWAQQHLFELAGVLFALSAGKHGPMQTPTVQRPASRAPAQGDNLFQLLGTRFAPDAGVYMLMAACVMLPTVWLPDLKALSYLGFFGVGATITVLCAVAYTYLSGSPASRAQLCPAAGCGGQQAVSLTVRRTLLFCAHAALAAAACAAPLSGSTCCSASQHRGTLPCQP